MSAQLIYDLAPLGSIVRYCDGTPRPPESHRKKLAAWENRNSGGRLIRKQAERHIGNAILPASVTLHKGDYGAGAVIVLRVHQTFSVNSELRFVVAERPIVGAVRILDHAGDDAELVHIAATRDEADGWLRQHGYPNAVLDEVTADHASDAVLGRAAL
jgi:hypothetical protein